MSSMSSDLPGGVVEEVDGRPLDQHVVVVGRAPHERRRVTDLVGHLQPEPVGEEPLGGGLVGGPDHDVAESAGPHRAFAQDPGRAGVRAPDKSRLVIRGFRGRLLDQPPGHRGRDLHAGDRFGGRHRVAGQAGNSDVDAPELAGDAADVVGVVHADFHLQQLPARRRHQAELPAAVGRRQPAVVFAGEPEVLVVAADGLDVWYSDRQRVQVVKRHELPFQELSGGLRDVPRTFHERVAEAADAGDPGLQNVAGREVTLR